MKMRKKTTILLILTIIIQSFLPYIKVNAKEITATIIDEEGVYLRSGPGTNHSTKALFTFGKKITLVSTTKHKGSGCDGWYQVSYNNTTDNYICSTLVKIDDDINPTNKGYYTTSTFGARINENYANVRSKTSMSSSIKDVLYLGTKVTILEEKSKTSDCQSGWYKVSYYNNRTGYICKRLIDKESDVTTTNEDYKKELLKAGFPESYIPFLTYLHKKYPNWIFKADKTNKKFSDVVSGETGKNYLQNPITQFRLSNKIKEKPNWYSTIDAVNAVLLDPRSYLNEKNIWVFEDLSYDEENHTKEILQELLDGTYLNTEEYLNYFLEASKEYNISPIHLVTRIKQEGGTNESYDGVSGKSTLTYDNKPLTGFYNYYNIGAYGDNPVARGLATAAGYLGNEADGLPWDSREKAIKFGAKFIATGYINKGQNTLYYQKFNTGKHNYSSAYTHQYMTNLIAPASESLSVYYAYNELKLMNTKYTFKIPVYEDMPKEYLTYPPVGDTNTNLKTITINNSSINGFDKDVLNYIHYIPSDTKEIEIKAETESNTSKISGTGTIEIKNQETTISIKVTSESQDVKTYTIRLIKTKEEEKVEDNLGNNQETKPDKEPEKEEIKKALSVDKILEKADIRFSNNYLSGISEKTTATTLANELNKIEALAKITITDKNKKTKTDALKTGDIINITSNNETKTYTISIKGDCSGDGKITSLDLLRVQKHILGYTKLTKEQLDSSDVNYDGKVNSLDLLRVQKHILKYIKLK